MFRSNRQVFAQIIDDTKGETLVVANEGELSKEMKRPQRAFALGKLLAEKAVKQKITEVVFDRGSYAYHGRVKSLALGAREGGLRF